MSPIGKGEREGVRLLTITWCHIHPSNSHSLFAGAQENKITGIGVFYYSTGDRYEGQLVDGRAKGKGTWYYANGDRHVGKWSDHLAHGEGTRYSGADKSYFIGVWEHGQLIQKVKEVGPSGPPNPNPAPLTVNPYAGSVIPTPTNQQQLATTRTQQQQGGSSGGPNANWNSHSNNNHGANQAASAAPRSTTGSVSGSPAGSSGNTPRRGLGGFASGSSNNADGGGGGGGGGANHHDSALGDQLQGSVIASPSAIGSTLY